jgi:hypothetical protein
LAIFKKIRIFSLFLLAKLKNFVVFVFTSVSRSPALFNGDFYMNLYSVDSNEAMKQGDEAFNGSSLQFLRGVKCFIASLLQYFTQR